MKYDNYRQFLGRYDLDIKYVSSSDLKYKLKCIKSNLIELCKEEEFILKELFNRHELIDNCEFISFARYGKK